MPLESRIVLVTKAKLSVGHNQYGNCYVLCLPHLPNFPVIGCVFVAIRLEFPAVSPEIVCLLPWVKHSHSWYSHGDFYCSMALQNELIFLQFLDQTGARTWIRIYDNNVQQIHRWWPAPHCVFQPRPYWSTRKASVLSIDQLPDTVERDR